MNTYTRYLGSPIVQILPYLHDFSLFLFFSPSLLKAQEYRQVLLIVYYVPITVLNVSYVYCYLVLSTTLLGEHYHPHIIDEKTETF